MKFLKAISIICSIIGFLAAGFGLFMVINSIGATDLNGIGVIFIMPSIINTIYNTFIDRIFFC